MNDDEIRRKFFKSLERHPLVESADFSRDGYRTIKLELKDELPEPVEV